MADVIRLKLERKEVDVFLESDNAEKKYTLKELSGSERNFYLNKMKSRVKIDKSGNTTINSFDGMQSDLLMLCLFDGEEPVSKDVIEDFPASTQQVLFENAQKLSGLDSGVAEEEKN